MEPNVKLYQKIANRFKTDIANGVYQVGDMLPAERLIAEQMEVSRTVIREAMIMLEVEGYVEVRKGSGIRVINTTIETPIAEASAALGDASFMLTCGPFELLQARQLFESNIAEFAATQATKQDLVALMKIQEQAKSDDFSRDSYWDSEFHIQLARCTQKLGGCACGRDAVQTSREQPVLEEAARTHRRQQDSQLVQRAR